MKLDIETKILRSENRSMDRTINRNLLEIDELQEKIRKIRIIYGEIFAEPTLKFLPQREREILELRFGLLDGEPKTYGELGKKFKVSRERIRQIEFKAISRIKKIRDAVKKYYEQNI